VVTAKHHGGNPVTSKATDMQADRLAADLKKAEAGRIAML
jgi:hypothetical protein